MFNFTPLAGAQTASCASQSLLELDGGVKVLIDVGWDESFSVDKLRNLEQHVPTLSLVLLTHATVAHLAAFAHCCKHFPLFTRIPIYATTPVIQLGRTLLQDLYSSSPLAATIISGTSQSHGSVAYPSSGTGEHESHILLEKPTNDEIASYFARIHPLKYSQPHEPLPSPFSPPLNGLTITAYNAGHTLGGTIWHIQHGLESIVYAVDWNQARENILAGAAWLGGAGAGGAEVIEQLRKPTALICSSRGAERVALAGGRTKRDEMLMDLIKSSILRGGTVLIPTDSSARVLELAYLLEHEWRKEAADQNSVLYGAGLYLCTKNIGATMRYTRSMLEWMDDSIIREFEAVAGVAEKIENNLKRRKKLEAEDRPIVPAGPFDFEWCRLVEKRSQVNAVLKERMLVDSKPVGRVILASDASLEWGFSRDVLRDIAKDDRNLIILTERQGKMTNDMGYNGVARQLWEWYEERRDGVTVERGETNIALDLVNVDNRTLQIHNVERVALEGAELESYNQWAVTQREVQVALNPGVESLDAAGQDVADADSDSSSSEEEDDTSDRQGRALNISTALGQAARKKVGLSDEDLGINILLRKKGVHDYDVRGKKGREKMFPLVIRRKRQDEFGELIRPEDYLRAEERDEVDGTDTSLRSGGYNTADNLGKKRKWEGPSRKHISSDPSSQRQQLRRNSRSMSRDIPDSLLNDTGFVHDVLGGPAEEEEALEEDIGPSKAVFVKEELLINLRLAFIDFAGLHDKRSLAMLMPLIQPRKLILISGLEEDTLALAVDCRRILGAGGEREADVYTPKVGEVTNASVDTNAWSVKLTHSLVKQLKWQKLANLGISTVSGLLLPAPLAIEEKKEDELEGSPGKKLKVITDGGKDENKSKDENMDKEISEVKEELKEGAEASKVLGTLSTIPAAQPQPTKASEPILDVIPVNAASVARTSARPLHVGDLRLAELRKLMLSLNYTAEFRGEGTLLIDGCVAIRKSGIGRVEIEAVARPPNKKGGSEVGIAGAPRNTFFEVRQMIYQKLAVVAGA